MQNVQAILLKIHTLLDGLIETARSLEKLSNEVASEEEINALQETQEETINELLKLDDDLHREFPEITENSKEKMIIHEKMSEFQRLNRKFIENLERGSGIIKFE